MKAMLMLLLVFGGTLALSSAEKRPEQAVPTYFDVQKRIEEAIPVLYRGAKVKDWVILDIKPLSESWDNRPYGKWEIVWSIDAVAVTDRDTEIYLKGAASFSPNREENRRWKIKLRDKLPPLSIEATR